MLVMFFGILWRLSMTKSSSAIAATFGLIAFTASILISGCSSSEHEPVKAVDTVDEAAELARANAPVAEVSEPASVAATPEATDGTDTTAADMAADSSATAVAEPTAAVAGGADVGQQVYETKCKTCHEPGLLNAPKLGDTAAWQPRIAQDKELLYKHSIEGLNAMPPKGGFTDVPDEDIKAAVDYMVEHSS